MEKKFIEKSLYIEAALKKMGWHTAFDFSGSEGSNSFYITISKELQSGTWAKAFDEKTDIFLNDYFERKIRFSDHELPAYYACADYDCRFDIDSSAWRLLKPILKKLFDENK